MQKGIRVYGRNKGGSCDGVVKVARDLWPKGVRGIETSSSGSIAQTKKCENYKIAI